MRKTIQTTMLVLALTVSAYAGEMQTPAPSPGEMQTPAASSSQTASTQQDGDMQNGVADNLIQTALNLLAVLPSLP